MDCNVPEGRGCSGRVVRGRRLTGRRRRGSEPRTAARARAEAGRVTPLVRQTGRGRRRRRRLGGELVVRVGGGVPQRLVCDLASPPGKIDNQIDNPTVTNR